MIGARVGVLDFWRPFPFLVRMWLGNPWYRTIVWSTYRVRGRCSKIRQMIRAATTAQRLANTSVSLLFMSHERNDGVKLDAGAA